MIPIISELEVCLENMECSALPLWVLDSYINLAKTLTVTSLARNLIAIAFPKTEAGCDVAPS
jgi:hypothetical protein